MSCRRHFGEPIENKRLKRFVGAKWIEQNINFQRKDHLYAYFFVSGLGNNIWFNYFAKLGITKCHISYNLIENEQDM